jgi:hypothetical protein
MSSENKMYEIKSFDMEKRFRDDYAIALIGRRGTGKTTVILNILHAIRHFQWGVIMCGTNKTLVEYSKRIPDCFCYKGLDTKLLDAILDHQNIKFLSGQPCEPIFVILDDLSFNRKALTANATVAEYLMNGRNANVFFVISMQDCKQVGPDFRDQFDIVFIMPAKKEKTVERIYEGYNTCFDSFKEFKQVFRACAPVKGSAMVVEVTGVDTKVEDTIFHYKSKLPDYWDRVDSKGEMVRWKVGGDWWKYHQSNYNKNWFMNVVDERDRKSSLHVRLQPSSEDRHGIAMSRGRARGRGGARGRGSMSVGKSEGARSQRLLQGASAAAGLGGGDMSDSSGSASSRSDQSDDDS